MCIKGDFFLVRWEMVGGALDGDGEIDFIIIIIFFFLEMIKPGPETKNKVRRTRASASLVTRNERFLEEEFSGLARRAFDGWVLGVLSC